MGSVYELEMSCDRFAYAEYEEWDEPLRKFVCSVIKKIRGYPQENENDRHN